VTRRCISLLVVTHCHDDHVGCLDQLVANDIVRPEWALITHPELGFGRGELDDGSHDDLRDIRTKVMTAALREEDASDLRDDQLQDFLDSAGTVEDRYKTFIRALKARNVKVVEYEG
jgi:glyoxylase-like metal-dependent hydrolase (beta-lactamase superfamily II)